MTKDKVCLDGTQIKNIGKAYAKLHPHNPDAEVCPKAESWIKDFFGEDKLKPKPKSKPKKPSTLDNTAAWIEKKAIRKIINKLEGFF